MRVTIQEVASTAGVSVSTVSRVLNDRAGVGEGARRAVLEAVRRLDYRPDQAARELVMRKTATVGWNDAHGARRLHPFATLMRERLFAALYAQGYRVEDVPSGEDGLPERLTDVMVVASPSPDDPRFVHLERQEVPFVVSGVVEGLRCVGPDDADGGRQAAQHLLRLGHRTLLVLTGKVPLGGAFWRPSIVGSLADARLVGFRAELHAQRVPFTSAHILTCDYTSLGAFFAVREALRAGRDFTALFALSDEMAVGAAAAIQDAGRFIPEDVSLIGFDDLPEMGGAFTTVKQDIPLFADTLAELTQEAARGMRPRRIVLPVQLVVRGTTGRVREVY